MKYVLLLLALLLSTNESFAARRGSPFSPDVDKRFAELEDALEGNAQARKQAKAVYDVAIEGGASTETYPLGVYLPAGAIITAAYLYINTAFTDGGTGSVRVNCTGSGDIMGYNDLTALSINQMLAGGINEAAPASSSIIKENSSANAGFNSVVTRCQLTAEVRSDGNFVGQSTGKFTLLVEYFDLDQ